MGQASSSPTRGERRRSLRSLRNSISYSKPERRSMSATFTMIDNSPKVDLLNVNVASEEELMTLPEVTRSIAHSIVEYRRAIGRFKRVDDLALVSGIGAEKLEKIRPEICVSHRRPGSCVSSSVQSLDSVRSTESGVARNNYVDVNKASVFELQSIQGISQEIAANIVHHREKKGPFKVLDDLNKVKGLDKIRYSVIRSHLVISCDEKISDLTTPKLNGYVSTNLPRTASINRTYSRSKLSVEKNASFGSPPMKDIFDLLSTYSPRPAVEDYAYTRNGKKAIRIATWNLQELTLEKAENPGFREVCCRTVLENRFSIIAIQDIVESAALKLICDELNNPTLRRVAEWKENNRDWKFHSYDLNPSCRRLGFLYNSSSGDIETEMTDTGTESTDTQRDGIETCLAKFVVDNNYNISLLNVFIKDNTNWSSAISKYYDSEKYLIALGDFSGPNLNTDTTLSEFQQHVRILPTDTNTSCVPDKSKDVGFSDNIYLFKGAKQQHTGYGGVIREGFVHLAIPKGWTWGGVASEHCPVWFEFYVEGNANQNNVSKSENLNGTIKSNGIEKK